MLDDLTVDKMDGGKVEISFELADVANAFLYHLRDVTNSVTLIYSAVNGSAASGNSLLPTDSFPVLISDSKPSTTIKEQKQLTIHWVFLKAFEEFVYGLGCV